MPETIKVPGPTAVQVGVGATALAVLGYTDNDVLPEFTVEQFNAPVLTSVGGDAPEEFVNRGSMASITLTLVKWDTVILTNILQSLPSVTSPNVEGEIGDVGMTWFGKGSTAMVPVDFSISIRIVPVLANQDGYVFPRCILNGPDAHRYIDWGNEGRKLSISFIAVPDDSDPRILYTRGVSGLTPPA